MATNEEAQDQFLEFLQNFSSRGGAAADAVARLQKRFTSMDASVTDVESSYRDINRQLKDSEEKIKKFKSATFQAGMIVSKGFKAAGESSTTGAASLKLFNDSVGDAVGSITKLFSFSILGAAVHGLGKAFFGLTSMTLGFADSLTKTNKSFAEAGIFFKGGIDEFDGALKDTGLTIDLFQKVIDESNGSLRLMSGGSSSGIRAVANSFKELRTANTAQLDQLYRLGYGTEEILSSMADYAAGARLAGKDLDTKEIAEGTAKYLKIQKELTRLTGVSLKDAKAKEEALKSDLAFSAFLETLPKELAENANMLRKFVANVPAELQPLVQTLITGGAVTDKQMALLRQAMGEDAVNVLKNLRESSLQRKLSDDEIANVSKNFAESMLGSMNQFMKGFTPETIQTILNTKTGLSELFGVLGPLKKTLIDQTTAGKQQEDTVKNAADATGRFAKAIPELEKAALSLRSVIFTLTSSLSGLLIPLVAGAAPMLAKSTDAVQKLIAGADEILKRPIAQGKKDMGIGFESEADRYKALMEYTMKNFSEYGGEITSATGNLFTELKDTITKSIEDGFDKVLKKIPGYSFFNPTDEEKIKSKQVELSNIQQTIEKMQDAMGKIDSSRPGANFVIDQFKKDIEKQKAESKKISDEITALQGRPTGPTQPIPNKAYGDIFSPRQGGHVIRVAEAQDSEIVAPAKRDPRTGKLGLILTDSMIDSSTLLKNIADMNGKQLVILDKINSRLADFRETSIKNTTKFDIKPIELDQILLIDSIVKKVQTKPFDLDQIKLIQGILDKIKVEPIDIDKVKLMQGILDKIKTEPFTLDQIKLIQGILDKIKVEPIDIDKVKLIQGILDKIKVDPESFAVDQVKLIQGILDKIKTEPFALDQLKLLQGILDKIKTEPFVLDQNKLIDAIVSKLDIKSFSINERLILEKLYPPEIDIDKMLLVQGILEKIDLDSFSLDQSYLIGEISDKIEIFDRNRITNNIIDIFKSEKERLIINLSDAISIDDLKVENQKREIEPIFESSVFDNSKLMRELVNNNKNSIDLLVGLNSKISDLNRGIDRLVEAQREANRLAI